jgi:hypothetical protein
MLVYDSAVGVATYYGLGAEGSEFESRSRQDFLHVIGTGSVALPAAYEIGTAGIKRPGCEVTTLICTSTPLLGMCINS